MARRAINRWTETSINQHGPWAIRAWQNGVWPVWHIVEQMIESGGSRYIIVSTGGNAMGPKFKTFAEAKSEFTTNMKRYLSEVR